jgi:hypothetical protein
MPRSASRKPCAPKSRSPDFQVWEFDPMLTRSAGRKLASLTVLAALALAPVPALAREGADEDFASDLNDPRKQEAMGNMMAAMMGVLLNLKAEPLARTMEQMGDHKAARKIPRGATLGDDGRDGRNGGHDAGSGAAACSHRERFRAPDGRSRPRRLVPQA